MISSLHCFTRGGHSRSRAPRAYQFVRRLRSVRSVRALSCEPDHSSSRREMPSYVATCLLPPTTWSEAIVSNRRELSDTYDSLSRTAKEVILAGVDEDTQRVRSLKAKGKDAHTRIGPVLKLLPFFTKSMVEIDYESLQGKQAHMMLSEVRFWVGFRL